MDRIRRVAAVLVETMLGVTDTGQIVSVPFTLELQFRGAISGTRLPIIAEIFLTLNTVMWVRGLIILVLYVLSS